MADLGQAYVQIIPSAEGISEKIQAAIAPGVDESAKKSGKSLAEGIGKGMSNVGGAMTKYVTAPIAAVGAAAVMGWKQVDEGLDTIVQKTGATGEAMESMQSIMENITSSMPTDFATAGAAIGEVNTRFGVTGDELETLSEQFIKFASLNDTDVSTSVDNVQKALTAFGLGAEDAGGLLDRLNKVGQDTGANVDGLAASLVQNGAAFQEMGLGIDEAATFLGQLETSGANADSVMSGLRKAMKNATEDGIPLNDALSTLQDTILNGTDNMDGLSAAYELFGRNGDAVYEAIQNGSLSFEDLAGAVADAGGSVSDTYQNTLDPMDQMQQVMNSLAVTGSELVVAVGPLLAGALTALTGVIKDATTWWRGLDEGTQKTILTIAGIVAVVGPVLSALGSLIATVASVSAAVTAAGGVMALITGPVGIAVAAVAGLIAAGVAIITNWDSIKEAAVEFKNSMVETWGNVKEAVGGKIDELKSDASSKWESIKSTTKGAVDGIRSGVTDKFENIKSGVTGKIDSIKSSMANKWNSIKSTTVNTISGIQSSVTGKFNSIKSSIEEKINGAKDTVRSAIDQIKGFFNFSWSLPHLELPHPYISGTFSLNPPSVPSFGINWYDKATNEPHLFRSATLFGAGEKHDEVLYGRQSLMDDIRKASGGGRNVTINVTVNGADNPEQWATRLVRQMELEVRTG